MFVGRDISGKGRPLKFGLLSPIFQNFNHAVQQAVSSLASLLVRVSAKPLGKFGYRNILREKLVVTPLNSTHRKHDQPLFIKLHTLSAFDKRVCLSNHPPVWRVGGYRLILCHLQVLSVTKSGILVNLFSPVRQDGNRLTQPFGVDVFFPLSVCFLPPIGTECLVLDAGSSDDKCLLFKYLITTTVVLLIFLFFKSNPLARDLIFGALGSASIESKSERQKTVESGVYVFFPLSVCFCRPLGQTFDLEGC